MSDQSPKSKRKTSRATRNATSSTAYSDGPSLFDGLDGRRAAKSGRARARANRSAAPASDSAPLTPGTSGPTGSDSFSSDCLSASLASKCRELLGTDGSMEYSQTWREKVTPAGRLYWAHTASARRTSDSGCTGWPTATVNDATGSGYAYSSGDHSKRVLKLPGVAALTDWPTPDHHHPGSPATDSYNAAGNNDSSRKTVELVAGWATPSELDKKAPPLKSYRERGGGSKGESLGNQVATSGPTSPSSPAETAKRGVLNPAFSLWLMGFPSSWLMALPVKEPRGRKRCAGSATQSSRS